MYATRPTAGIVPTAGTPPAAGRAPSATMVSSAMDGSTGEPRVLALEEASLVEEVRAESVPSAVVAPAGATWPTGATSPAGVLTRVAGTPSSVETRAISDGLPCAVMVGRWAGPLGARARCSANRLVTASLSRRADKLPSGVVTRPGPFPRAWSASVIADEGRLTGRVLKGRGIPKSGTGTLLASFSVDAELRATTPWGRSVYAYELEDHRWVCAQAYL